MLFRLGGFSQEMDPKSPDKEEKKKPQVSFYLKGYGTYSHGFAGNDLSLRTYGVEGTSLLKTKKIDLGTGKKFGTAFGLWIKDRGIGFEAFLQRADYKKFEYLAEWENDEIDNSYLRENATYFISDNWQWGVSVLFNPFDPNLYMKTGLVFCKPKLIKELAKSRGGDFVSHDVIRHHCHLVVGYTLGAGYNLKISDLLSLNVDVSATQMKFRHYKKTGGYYEDADLEEFKEYSTIIYTSDETEFGDERYLTKEYSMNSLDVSLGLIIKF